MCDLLEDQEWQVAAPRRRAGGAKLKACAATMAPPCPGAAAVQRAREAQPAQEARCYACGALARCADTDHPECACCGYFEPRVFALLRPPQRKAPPQHREPSATRARSLSPDSPLPPLGALAPKQRRCAAPSAEEEEEEADGAPVDFGELPPLSASPPASGPFRRGSEGGGAAACVACSPARRCGVHAFTRITPARLAPRRTPEALPSADAAAPLRAGALVGAKAEAAYAVPTLDAAQRARVLAASSHASSSHASSARAASARAASFSVDALRARMGGEKAAAAQRLDTAWSAEANEPRSRVRAMIAAGWAPVAGTWAGHPRWERTLSTGPLAGTRQVLCFSSTYSVFCWDAQTADLARMDRQARGE
jgi:hypothetical protein